MSRARPLFSVLSVLCWTLGILLAAMRWRFSPAAWDAAWPGPGAGLLVGLWLGIPALAAAVLAVAGQRPRNGTWRLWMWPAVPLAAVWLVLPTSGRPDITTMVALPLLAGMAWWLWRRGPNGRPDGERGWLDGRLWRWTHAVVLPGGVAVGLALDGFNEPGAVLLSCALYPLYALLQLTILMVLPWPWIRNLGGRPSLILLAGLFALVHWPNALVMALTGVGMLFWAREYRRGRPIPALAVSMGLLATVVAQGLPESWTHHMQVGPTFVQRQAVTTVTAEVRAATAIPDATALQVIPYLQAIYPRTVRRAAEAPELRRWLQVVKYERRCQLAWAMLQSEEAQRRRQGDVPATDDPTIHWTAAAPPWPTIVREHVATIPPAASWETALAAGYRGLLGREAAPEELLLWDPDLSELQYQALTRHLLAHHRKLARASFDTLASEELLFWR